MTITDIEVLRLHYTRTIELWRERFAANHQSISYLYDARFCRMFEFYLVSAERAFHREREAVYQIQLSPGQTALPFTRDYMPAEARAGVRPAAQRDCGPAAPR
jgi:cyclopropane-fatty-acyl-phospholipid synthase